eukprot:scaffold23528_cov96-Isochrysis_galbana.AAC.2
MRKIADGEATARTAHSAPNGGRGVMYNVVMRDAAHLAFKSATTMPPPRRRYSWNPLGGHAHKSGIEQHSARRRLGSRAAAGRCIACGEAVRAGAQTACVGGTAHCQPPWLLA